jgi:hypothetical protein
MKKPPIAERLGVIPPYSLSPDKKKALIEEIPFAPSHFLIACRGALQSRLYEESNQ